MVTTHLKRTSLFETHISARARMVEFAGWEMPVQYAGIVDEHRAVRSAAGLFDVSHMGEVEVSGPGALESVQRLVTNDAGRLIVGQGLYSPMCLPSGGIIDDLTVFRLATDRYLLIVNASRTARDFQWIAAHTQGATARDRSADFALMALQGPRAQSIFQRLTRTDLGTILPFYIRDGLEAAGVRCLVARTGYTGEDGFEIACEWDAAPRLWRALMEAGRPDGLVPAGLGARDTLRLEAGLMLYGNDIDETTTPLEARLGWTLKFDKGEFLGRAALAAQKERGVSRRLVGFAMTARAVPRPGYPVLTEGRRTGQVTSGTFGPSVNKGIGLGYVESDQAQTGRRLQVEIRGRPAEANVVKLPFYKRGPSPSARSTRAGDDAQ